VDMPTRKASTTGSSTRSPRPAPEVTATSTPTTARALAARRAGVISCGAAGPSRNLSTTRALTVWPPIRAIRKVATPTRGTAYVWVATTSPPANPPNNCQGGRLPSRSACRTARTPLRNRRVAHNSETAARPVRKLSQAAVIGGTCVPSSPLTRDCTARITPHTNAATSASARSEGRGRKRAGRTGTARHGADGCPSVGKVAGAREVERDAGGLSRGDDPLVADRTARRPARPDPGVQQDLQTV